jgi:hypothetical protein
VHEGISLKEWGLNRNSRQKDSMSEAGYVKVNILREETCDNSIPNEGNIGGRRHKSQEKNAIRASSVYDESCRSLVRGVWEFHARGAADLEDAGYGKAEKRFPLSTTPAAAAGTHLRRGAKMPWGLKFGLIYCDCGMIRHGG